MGIYGKRIAVFSVAWYNVNISKGGSEAARKQEIRKREKTNEKTVFR